MIDEHGEQAEVADLEDEYEILGELGRGGSAVVYRGRDRVLGREVAIKVVRARHGSSDDDALARLAREARTVAQLQHPNIVTVHAVKRLRDEGLALVMQLVPGRTLKEAIVQGGPLSPEHTERVMRDVAEALAYAHAHGVVHRDVKPENIFLDETSGRALLSDFGIAHSAEFDSRLTMTGTAIGTPAYMSPEQIDGATADARSDVYSLGLVAWEMLTGRRPWEGESLYNIIFRQKNEDLTPIDELRPGVPPRLQYVVERMLQKKPAARWAGAEGLLAHLNASVLPADWRQWQAAHKRRRERARAAERGQAQGFIGAALATVRFRRPSDAELAAAATAAPTPAVATPAVAAPPDDDTPSWAVEPRESRSARRIAIAAVALLVIAGGAVAGLAGRDRDGSVIAAPVDTRLADAGTIEVPVTSQPAAPPAPAVPTDSASLLSAGPAPLLPPTAQSATPVGPTPTPAAVVTRRSAGEVVAPAPPPAPAESIDAEPAATVRVTEERGIIAAGGRHSCALGGGRVFCWGANDHGQLGDGDVESRPTALGIVGDLDFAQVSAGIAHSCGVTRGGEAYCWGGGERGQLGDATTTSRNAPVRVAGNLSFRSVRTGSGHSCGVTTTGRVACWGSNASGQLGDGSANPRSAPVVLPTATRFIALSVGWNHSCGLASTGTAFCWGDNAGGQIGDGTRADRRTPTAVAGNLRFVSIAAGSAHTCAVTPEGTTYCWGQNRFGQLGTGSTTDRPTPTRVETPVQLVSVAAGSVHNCGRTRAGVAFCWGRNVYGQLGDGTFTDRAEPVRVVGGTSYVAISAAGAHTCGTSTDGEASCWGYNVEGQLGDGSRNHRPRPARVELPAR
jgi:alpha-tubulin suppressor-like RCC1 family protein/tRNA A-37 threonylcarbamoyl transferase component Bud32